MSVKRIDPGPRMSSVVVHNGVAYLAGEVASDPKADITGQTQDVLRSIDESLGWAGTNKSNLLRAQIYLADMADFAAMNKVWDAWSIRRTRRRAPPSRRSSPAPNTRSKS